MKSAAASLKTRIEAALADKIPAALTPVAKLVREATPTGVATVDELLHGGIPVGALTEMVGAECSGRTSLALATVAKVTQAERVCAWVDASDSLSPESAAASGIDLARLLWVRCGAAKAEQKEFIQQPAFALPAQCTMPPVAIRGLHGGGHGGHPRNEVKGMSESMNALLQPAVPGPEPRCAAPQRLVRHPEQIAEASPAQVERKQTWQEVPQAAARIERALRVTDLLLQAGGFSVLVLDLGGIAAEHVLRIPMATWFRYRAAAERTRTSVVVLTQHACTRSSAGLVLHLRGHRPLDLRGTVLRGFEREIEIVRQRFTESPSNVIPMRKPPQRASSAAWTMATHWAGER